MKLRNIDNFYLYTSFYIEHVELQYKLKTKTNSKDKLNFGFNEHLIEVTRYIRSITSEKCPRATLVEPELSAMDCKIFQYFLIDGLFEYSTIEERLNVLAAFTPFLTMISQFLINFVFKHIPHYDEILEKLTICLYEHKEIFIISENNNYRLFNNINHTELQIIFEQIGLYVKNLKLIVNFMLDSALDNVIIDRLIKIIQKECKNLKSFSISKVSQYNCFSFPTREELIEKHPFLNNIDFKIDIREKFITNPKSNDDLELMLLPTGSEICNINLATETLTCILTTEHLEKFFKRTFQTLKLTTYYSQIPNWQFLKNIVLNNSIALSELCLIDIIGIQEMPQLCIGQLFIGLHHLNSELSIDRLRISSYTFKDFKVDLNLNIQSSYLVLKNCKFDDSTAENNALHLFKTLSILKLTNTRVPMQMYQHPIFSNLIEILFNDCNYLNDDLIFEIYKFCKKAKVRQMKIF